jgi:two-component system, LuxR family, response regulator FixJ
VFLRVIDADLRRRAELTSMLSDRSVRVEPYENVAELTAYWPSEGTLVVHDDDECLPSVIHAMADAGKWLPVVAYAQKPSVEKVVSALELGALDYVAWPIPRDAMLTKLQDVTDRGNHMASKQREIAEARAQMRRLSLREREVLSDLSQGLSNKEIAMHLGISPRTVEIHRSNLITKIGAKSSAHAIRIAIRGDLD